MCSENNGSVGRRHVEFAQTFVIWWWIIQVSSLVSHDLYSYHAVKRCIFHFAMKSRVLLRSEVGLIMVSICLHGIISWSQASGRGRFSPNKNCHSWKIPPICLKILLDMDSMQYFKQNDEVLWRCLFIWACEGLSIPKALHIDVWEMAGVTAMAAGCEQTQSAHARDVSLGARIS